MRKLLLKGLILNGVLEVKCRFCKEICMLNSTRGPSLENDCFIVLVNKDGFISKHSMNALSLLGYEEKELPSLATQDVFEGITEPVFRDMWNKFQERRSAEARLMLHYKTKAGKPYPARIEVQLLELPEETFLSFVVYKNMHIWLAQVV